MVLLLIFSIILIIFHVSSLRLIVRLGNMNIEMADLDEIDMRLSSRKEESKGFLIPAVIIVIMSLLEIAYFVISAYIFNDIIITSGAAVLTGYSIYSLIKFLPDLRSLNHKPSKYFNEKNYKLDNFINFFMVIIEIAFCAYVVFKVLSNYGLFV
jgi:hypothetical protein